MDQTSCSLFTAPALSQNQHWNIHFGQQRSLRAELAHGRASRHEEQVLADRLDAVARRVRLVDAWAEMRFENHLERKFRERLHETTARSRTNSIVARGRLKNLNLVSPDANRQRSLYGI